MDKRLAGMYRRAKGFASIELGYLAMIRARLCGNMALPRFRTTGSPVVLLAKALATGHSFSVPRFFSFPFFPRGRRIKIILATVQVSLLLSPLPLSPCLFFLFLILTSIVSLSFPPFSLFFLSFRLSLSFCCLLLFSSLLYFKLPCYSLSYAWSVLSLSLSLSPLFTLFSVFLSFSPAFFFSIYLLPFPFFSLSHFSVSSLLSLSR